MTHPTDALVERLRAELKAERLKPCRHTTLAEQESKRPDLHQWQTDQREWFDPTILEIVSEYAEWRDRAALSAMPDPAGWRSMESCPKTGEVVLFHVPSERFHMNRADDFHNGGHWLEKATHWRPLPPPGAEPAGEPTP